MKPFLRLALFSLTVSSFAACQPDHHEQARPSGQFEHQTEREMNPRTGNFEGQPPYSAQSNKPDR